MAKRHHLPLIISTLLLGTFLAACAPKQEPNITIENGAFRMPAPGQTTGAAYFDIVNTGGKDTLLSASTPVSDHSELHIHLHDNGIMRMRQVQSVDVTANDTTIFKRGGRHVMVFNMNAPQGAKSIPMSLNFKHFGAITFNAQISDHAPTKH